MPVYEYTCRGCGHEFELLVRGGVTPACPGCQGEALERRLSLPARPAGPGRPDFSTLGPPTGGGVCGGGSCGCH